MNTDLATVLDAADQQLTELGTRATGPAEAADRGGPWDNRPTWDNWHNRR